MRYCLAVLFVLAAGPVFADDFLDRVAALEAQNAAKVKPVIAKDCGCTSPADCTCPAGTCTCAACATPKHGQTCKANDGGPDWTWNANHPLGAGWYRPAHWYAERPATPAECHYTGDYRGYMQGDGYDAAIRRRNAAQPVRFFRGGGGGGTCGAGG